MKLKKLLIQHKNTLLYTLVALLALKVFLPQIEGLLDSLTALGEANLSWILIGTLVYFAGIPILTIQFMALSMKKLAFWLTFKVEMATLFVNKLLPSGVGTISLNLFYLVKKSHTANQATAVLTMNTLTSSVAYLFLILLALTQSSVSLDGLRDSVDIPLNLILFLLVLAVSAVFVLLRSNDIKKCLSKAWIDFKINIKTYKHRPKAILAGLVCNGLGSATSIFALFASAQAVGLSITMGEALLAYTFGNIASALVPTPGGVGSAEVGIYSGLVLTGVDGPDAMLITLLYRLITYWVPIIPGYLSFWRLKNDLLSDYSVKKKVVKEEK